MKKLLLTTGLFYFMLSAMAQDLPGFRTGSFNGVLGIYTPTPQMLQKTIINGTSAYFQPV